MSKKNDKTAHQASLRAKNNDSHLHKVSMTHHRYVLMYQPVCAMHCEHFCFQKQSFLRPVCPSTIKPHRLKNSQGEDIYNLIYNTKYLSSRHIKTYVQKGLPIVQNLHVQYLVRIVNVIILFKYSSLLFVQYQFFFSSAIQLHFGGRFNSETARRSAFNYNVV